ncbi:MAG: glycosyltransferase family 4 protein [Methanobacteriaceae archaeon]|nr:glycosyltransferase family 4 protein [Methanobacteriaceae archaeon]
MKICIIGQYPPQIGGIATYTSMLEDVLKKEGHTVYILTYASSDRADDEYHISVPVLNIPLFRGVFFTLFSIIKLIFLIRKYDIDLVHAHYLIPPGLIAVVTKLFTGINVVVTVHGSDINILPDNKLLKPVLRYVLNHADSVYFVSYLLKEKAEKLFGNISSKSYVTKNTVNIDKFNGKCVNRKSDRIIVSFIGNLVKQKGLNYLLMAKKDSVVDYDLCIYGDGVEKDNLLKIVHENNIKNVYFKGSTNVSWKVIACSDIIVLPSISEGSSIVALEAMSSEKPLVATRAGNISDIISNYKNGVLVDIGDSDGLRIAIDKLVEDSSLRKRIGVNARNYVVENFSVMEVPYMKE